MTTTKRTRDQELELVTKWRRALHQIPELELTLPKTQAYLLEQLKPLNCTITQPIDYAIAAYFDGKKEETIAFRADMDALPVYEQSGRDFASLHEGHMHACGHDGHMSALLLLAYRINDILDHLPCNILLIFQPGEETPGGAGPIVDTGIFQEKNVKAVYGLHLWPMLEAGTAATKPGPLMSRVTEVTIDISGKSSHLARYKQGIDAMLAGTELLQRAYMFEEQSLSNNIYRLLRFGKMEAGRARNVVADACHIEGSIRAFDDTIFFYLIDGLETLCQDLAEETGTTINITYSSGYPAVINDEQLVDYARANIPELALLDKPEMISEDFAAYQQIVPGIFFFLGTGTGIELHDSHFDFNEEVLLHGADLFEKLARLGLPK